MAKKKSSKARARASWKPDREALFSAQGAYAESIFKTALGDSAGSIAALKAALSIKPDYAPAILSMGSVEYQRGNRNEGRRLFLSLLSLPKDTEDLCEIIDEAGDFLTQTQNYTDGLDLFRGAVQAFPDYAQFHEGAGCCAGHQGLFDEALEASARAVELEPGNACFVSDLGWTLFLAGRYEEAEAKFLEAIAMDPTDQRAKANLDHCRETVANLRGIRSQEAK